MEYLISGSKIVLATIYFLSLTLLCIYGIERYYLCYTYRRDKHKKPVPKNKFANLPVVTVQLPIYNEMHVVKRLIESACDMNYPKDLLEIQVLDDSTDKTVEIAAGCVNEYKKRNVDIKHIHRENREGFKAGALKDGLKSARGELIAIFDADFIPPEDFLRKTVDFFYDPKVGGVQARWGHINKDYSTLTKAQSILLDGHFIIEQTVRFNNGMFFNFNGTAGVLRKKCVESAGGWQHDTLTEDLDLSYRAQLAGWKLIYLRDVIVDAELPVDMNAFKSQQHRWVKGGVQTALKILPRILVRNDLPIKIKSEAVFHLLGNISYLLLLILLVLMFPMTYFWHSIGMGKTILLNLLAVSIGTLSFIIFYIVTVREIHKENWLESLKYIPVAISVGIGLSVNNAKAALGALLGKRSEFKRTPKFAVSSSGSGDSPTDWRSRSYVPSKETTALAEVSLGMIFFAQTIYVIYAGYVLGEFSRFIGWIPFLLLIQSGFLYVGFLAIRHSSKKALSEH